MSAASPVDTPTSLVESLLTSLSLDLDLYSPYILPLLNSLSASPPHPDDDVLQVEEVVDVLLESSEACGDMEDTEKSEAKDKAIKRIMECLTRERGRLSNLAESEAEERERIRIQQLKDEIRVVEEGVTTINVGGGAEEDQEERERKERLVRMYGYEGEEEGGQEGDKTHITNTAAAATTTQQQQGKGKKSQPNSQPQQGKDVARAATKKHEEEKKRKKEDRRKRATKGERKR